MFKENPTEKLPLNDHITPKFTSPQEKRVDLNVQDVISSEEEPEPSNPATQRARGRKQKVTEAHVEKDNQRVEESQVLA